MEQGHKFRTYRINSRICLFFLFFLTGHICIKRNIKIKYYYITLSIKRVFLRAPVQIKG